MNFSFEEIAAACHNVSPNRCVSEGLSSVMYRASLGEDNGFRKRSERTIASLQHLYLCKLIGFHAREGSDRRLLVCERLFHGSLDRLLYGRTGGPPIEWNARMKVALCAAQGLTNNDDDNNIE
ncbi:hypothetical protein L2E82_22903 [Cichorium intybus]|uniref:Uncharacterized protein n=1 Tax=Cichorium intybus TaxID=13427 RepID=A0ACB9E018_CICIN|nr:hypothetical protein L2E82_22903 [Cichorium intybus]